MKPPRLGLSTDSCPRQLYCALGPTEILATLQEEETLEAGGRRPPPPFIWEAYELDHAKPAIEWPYEDTDEEIREKLNSAECDCTPHASINFADPIRFSELILRDDSHQRPSYSRHEEPTKFICAATIKCTDCEFEAVMHLVLTKRWYDGYEDKAQRFDPMICGP